VRGTFSLCRAFSNDLGGWTHLYSRFSLPVATIPSALFLVTLLFAAPAQAQVVVTLTPNFAFSTPGSTVTYRATIQNQSATQSVFFNQFAFSFNGTSGDTQDVINTVDRDSFFSYFETAYPTRQLPANTTYTGNLVDVTIRANAPEGAMDAGTFTISGGVTATEANTLAQLGFTITSTVIPESPSVGLLGYGAVALIGSMAVRRRNR